MISSCGKGIPVYRRLQKEDIPFGAGILYTNDIDYQLARLLASEVVAEKPFCEIGDDAYEKAVNLIQRCRRVVDAGAEIGSCNRRLKELLTDAERQGKLYRV